MNKRRIEDGIKRGTGRWQAARLKPVVKRLGSKKVKKRPKA